MRRVLLILVLLGARPAFALDGGKVMDHVLHWSGYAAVASVVIDAFAPNWEIQEARFPGNHYRLLLQMKRTYNGGAGEARVVFNRRAQELMLAGGFDAYEIVEYSEGMESSVIGGQRNASGVIRLNRNR